MKRLRRVLVERYIGLVMICVLLFQAAQFAGLILQNPFEGIVVQVYNHARQPNTFALNPSGRLPFLLTLWQIAFLIIELLIAFGLYRWLYPASEDGDPLSKGLLRSNEES